MYIVYKHTTPNGKAYVGVTRMEPERRWRHGEGYKKHVLFHRAIEKYGWENIRHEILFEGLTQQEASEKEIELIRDLDLCNPSKGYNIDTGGFCKGKHSAATRAKLSESIRKAYLEGRIKPVARVPSQEERQRHSEFMKGNTYNKGHHHTEEFKAWKSQQMHEKYSNGGVHNCKPVEEVRDGVVVNEYFALSEAARHEQCTASCLYKHLRNGKEYKGSLWRYKKCL